MADLTVEYAGLELKNPIITSACSLGNSIAKLKRLEAAGAGAVTTKLISSAPQRPDHDFPYRMSYRPEGWMVAGDPNLSLEYGVNLVRAAKRELQIPVIANFIGLDTNPDTWVHDALALEKAGADALEMDLYCRINSDSTRPEDLQDGGHSYLSICAFPEALGSIVRALIDAVDIPVIPKMNLGVPFVTPVAQTLIDAGARTIVMSNGMGGNPGVDIYKRGEFKVPFAAVMPADLPLSGRYLFAMHNRALIVLKMELGDQAQFGTGGGVFTWDEIVQRIMLGGQTVQLCSTIYENGPAVIQESLEAMALFMDTYGYENLDQLRGISLDGMVGRRAEAAVEPAVARVKDRVALVGRAEDIVRRVQGTCLAMSMGSDGAPEIDERLCIGCGWCVHHAGDGSIELVRTEQFVSDLDVFPHVTTD